MLLIILVAICAGYAVAMLCVKGSLKRRSRKTYEQILSSAEEAEPDEAKRRLEQFKEHLDSGLITKEEYKARRNQVLKKQ